MGRAPEDVRRPFEAEMRSHVVPLISGLTPRAIDRRPLWGLNTPSRIASQRLSAMGTWLILAARMKSFSDRPPIAWVQSSTATWRYPSR